MVPPTPAHPLQQTIRLVFRPRCHLCLITGNASAVDSELTVLSALMDIGVIPEKDVVTRKDPALYFEWLRIFSAVTNPLIFVTDRNSVAWRVIEERWQRPTVVSEYL